MAAAAIGLLLIARGCSDRKDSSDSTKVITADGAVAGDKSQSAEHSLSAEDDGGFDLPEREEIRQKRTLTPGTHVFVVGVKDTRVDTSHSQVFVIGVNGRVKVETADTDTAEVLIVRSARKRDDLQSRKVEIDEEIKNGPDLFIRIGSDDAPDRRVGAKVRYMITKGALRKYDDAPSPDPAPEIRQRVLLRLPRKAGLEIRGVGGDVTVGEVRGQLKIAEVTGNVRVARAAGPAVVGNVDGAGYITGRVDITFAPLNNGVIRIAGVNGDVHLRFEGDVNANLTTYNIVGAIKPDFPNVEIRESEPVWGGMKARIGNGGSLVEIANVKGNVTLSKAANSDAAE
jgi:hypothetical protein